MFKTFETLATFDPDLMARLIQAGKQALIQLEQKRGVGADMQLRSVFRRIKSVVFVGLRYLRACAIANRSRKLCFLWAILRRSRYFLYKKCFLLTCPGQSYFTLTFLSSKSIPTSISYVSFCLLVKCSVKITSSCIFRHSSCVVPTSSETWACILFAQCYFLFYPFVIVICFNTEHLGCVPDRIGISKSWFLKREENRSTRKKTSGSKGENQQQTQSAYGVDAGI